MENGRFWRKSYDPGMTDIDPARFETDYITSISPAFAQYPQKSALSFMGVEISFAELSKYANRFAHMLRQAGLAKGDVVAVNLPNIPEYVIAWLGILKAGCVVSGLSPLLSRSEMMHQLTDARAKGLVTLDVLFEKHLVHLASKLPELRVVAVAEIGGFLPPLKRFLGKLLKKLPSGRITPLTGKTVRTFRDIIKPGVFPDTDPPNQLTPDDVAYLQYTGGTTGPPKGALITHRNAVADLLIAQTWLGWEPGRGLALSGFPFFHIAGLFFCENCIFLGWTQVLIANPRDTNFICDQIAKHKPTVLVNVPSLFQLLMANPKFKTLDHSGLNTCISAASPFPEESQKALETIVGSGKLLEVYGMTETSPLTVMNPSKGQRKLGTIGLPLINTAIKLVEPGTNQPVPLGTPGEICVRGPQVMKGYFNNPSATLEAIDAEGFLHTGDVAVMDEDGYLRIVDRTKDMIIVGGFKVFSKKVEEVLSAHPAVELIAIIGVNNIERPGSELVKAVIKSREDWQTPEQAQALEASIVAFARQRLAPYEVPKIVTFRDQLPLTPVGKIDKKKLRQEKIEPSR